jgi:FixJ family two-component response regulator
MGSGGRASYAGLSTTGVDMAERPLVAIVDDDKSIRDAASDLLKASGFAPAAFEDAERFLGWPGRAGVACLIADMHMPGMSGLELYEALVASSAPIPTVIITAHPEEATRVRAGKAGVCGYLGKPFGPDELLECVDAALALSRRNPIPRS